MRHILIALSIALLLLTSCKKEKDKLPSATATGANTFGCLVDGKAWLPTGGGFWSGVNPTSGGFFRNVDQSLNVYIKAYAENEAFQIFLKHVTSAGTYELNQDTDIMPGPIFPESYGSYSLTGQDDFITDASHTGRVQITYADTLQGIVAGTFEMQLFQKSTGKVINVSKGRFDYKNH
jgi:hypothetical protein